LLTGTLPSVVATFISRFPSAGPGARLAVKDLIDVAGEVTTAGSRAVADLAQPAAADAACLAGARAAGAVIVGKTNLHELAFGVSGINPWFGTPVNPLDPARVPGGSSSGSAVAVGSGEADVAYGSDSGGSIRIPAACCGVAGLKTTWGRISTEGVWPLAPSLDTIGPMASDVRGLALGMGLLEEGFGVGKGRPFRVGRKEVEAEPAVWAAVDRALAAVGWEVTEAALPGWDEASRAGMTVLLAEAWASDQALLSAYPDRVSADVAARLRDGERVDAAALARARATGERWQAELALAFRSVDFVVTPTLRIPPPTLERASELMGGRHTMPVNLAGVPALALPVPTGGPLPASLQLIGPAGSEEELLAAGLALEEAVVGG
jgi:amidase